MDNLKFSASYLYVENKGEGTFGYQNAVVLNNPPVLNIDNFDSSKQQYFNLQGNLELQQELVDHRRLLVHEVQPQRHRHRRLPVHPAVPGRDRRPTRA